MGDKRQESKAVDTRTYHESAIQNKVWKTSCKTQKIWLGLIKKTPSLMREWEESDVLHPNHIFIYVIVLYIDIYILFCGYNKRVYRIIFVLTMCVLFTVYKVFNAMLVLYTDFKHTFFFCVVHSFFVFSVILDWTYIFYSFLVQRISG